MCSSETWDAKHDKTTESSCHSTMTPYHKVLLGLCATKYYSTPYNLTTVFMFGSRNTLKSSRLRGEA